MVRSPTGGLSGQSSSVTMPQHKRLSLEVAGVVQGVGFRPFVYRLAK